MDQGLIAFLESVNSPNVAGLKAGDPFCLQAVCDELLESDFHESAEDVTIRAAIALGILPNSVDETMDCVSKWYMFVREEDREVLDMVMEVFRRNDIHITSDVFLKLIRINTNSSQEFADALNFLITIIMSVSNFDPDEFSDNVKEHTLEELKSQLEDFANLEKE